METLPEDSNEDLSEYDTCRSCGMKFDSFGDMQRHMLVEDMQKGDIISEESWKLDPSTKDGLERKKNV